MVWLRARLRANVIAAPEEGRILHNREAESRWSAVDAVRGMAMVFVCLSHFGLTYFPQHLDPRARFMGAIGKMATPTFVIVSGLLLGYLAGAGGSHARALRRRFLDRGLFLLLVARGLIFLAHIPKAGGVLAALRWGFVTDVVALSMIAAPGSVMRLSRCARLALSAALFSVSWLLVGVPMEPGWHTALKEILVGAPELHECAYVYPAIPWFCVYAAATVLGQRLREVRAEEEVRVGRVALRVALVAFGLAALGELVHLLAPRLAGRGLGASLAAFTALGQKLPPGPSYVAFFGGVALLTLAAFVELERSGQLSAARRLVELIGRNSLFAFVVQYFVYYTAMVLLHPRPSRLWPLWLLGSMGMVLLATVVWDRMRGNRFITVGLRA